jgi:hypothetical protein
LISTAERGRVSRPFTLSNRIVKSRAVGAAKHQLVNQRGVL